MCLLFFISYCSAQLPLKLKANRFVKNNTWLKVKLMIIIAQQFGYYAVIIELEQAIIISGKIIFPADV